MGRHGVRVTLLGGSQMPGSQNQARHRRNQGLALHERPPHPRPSRDATSSTRGRRGPHNGGSLRARGLGELVGAPQKQSPATNPQVPSPLLGREQELASPHPAPMPARMGHGPSCSQTRPKGSGYERLQNTEQSLGDGKRAPHSLRGTSHTRRERILHRTGAFFQRFKDNKVGIPLHRGPGRRCTGT